MRKWTAVQLAEGLALCIEAEGDALRRAHFAKVASIRPSWLSESDRDDELPVLRQAVRELNEYWAGERQQFTVAFELDGTEFQCKVWEALWRIPYGQVRTYSDIAKAIGKPKAVRAVGAANGANPLPVIVPCHRVIGADGSLTGFGGGLDVKHALLQREGILP